MRWLAGLRALPAEYLVVDVGPGHGDFAVDLMLAADIAIAVTVPEPPAIEETYRFLRAAFRRRLRRVARPRQAALVDARARAGRRWARSLRPSSSCTGWRASTRALAEMAWAEAQAMRVQLVVNQTRVRTDAELGAWMSGLVSRHYGVALDELGHVEHDDTVWLTVRRNKPLLVDSPDEQERAQHGAHRAARRWPSPPRARPSAPRRRPCPTEEPTLYAVLGVTRSASDEEIRRAYKRQREIYATGGLATVSLLDGEQLAGAQRKLDEAYDTLLDPVRRRAYDLSTFPEPEPEVLSARTTRPGAGRRAADAPGGAAARDRPRHRVHRRRSCARCASRSGSSWSTSACKTKIARAHLQAIEDERFDELPALVYTRGFLGELAKMLRLDPTQVQKTYLRRMREELAARGKELA